MSIKTLVINMGSTSTKLAVFDDVEEVMKAHIMHEVDELICLKTQEEQKKYRTEIMMKLLEEKHIDLALLDAVAVRGGTFKPIEGGVYVLNQTMIEDMMSGEYGYHPSNIGNEIAYGIAQRYDIPAIIADPEVTNEFCRFARYSGVKGLERVSSFHALNQKRTARKVAAELGTTYEDMNLIVVHMGGGISVAAHEKGKVIDVNNSLDGDGPFSPERAGTLAASDVINMCFSGRYSKQDMLKMIKGNGGLMSYLGTNSGIEVEKRIESGDVYAAEVYEAMAYHVSKEVAAMSAPLKGRIDGIVFTGNLVFSKMLIDWIVERISFLAPVYLKPGENEMLSLAEKSVEFLSGRIVAKEY